MALDWDDIQVFLAAESAGSLTGGASRLGISVATVSRRLERMEQQLGRKLFQRHASGLSLLPDAVELLERARGVQDQVFDFLRLASSGEEGLSGTVTLTTIETIITRLIAPAFAAFRQRYPRINLVLRATSRITNLTDRSADIALRLVRPRESYAIGQKVATVRLGLYASEAYLSRRGTPEDPAHDLRGHDLITYDQRFDAIPEVAWFRLRSEPEDLALRVNSALAIAASVEAGAGIGLLPTFMASEGLVCLWSGDELPAREVWLVVHEDLRDVPRIRAVFDFLRDDAQRYALWERGSPERS